jgi:mannose-6-phosphate isomerase-like protein (cupin superfamily)
MFHGKIDKLTLENNNFREVIWTGENCQLVLMSIPVDEQIDEEVHSDTDQLLFFVEGSGKAILDDQQYPFEKGDVLVVPSGIIHTIINTGDVDLKLYSVYAPQEHPANTVHQTKADAQEVE